jgi:hypothetical protein
LNTEEHTLPDKLKILDTIYYLIYSPLTFPDPNWKPESKRRRGQVEGYVDWDICTIFVHQVPVYEETWNTIWH